MTSKRKASQTKKHIDARNIIKLNQTVLLRYSPWQGINITGTEDIQNTSYNIDARDKDKRAWCELNHMTLIELNYDESEEQWRAKFD